ncbi:MAG: CoA pyrophosphatase [Tissierellia bacterium]|nr:CoA pyrophosphatase [Tissierellia bacterium]
MKEERIFNIFHGRYAKPLGLKDVFSVLLPLIQVEGELCILYEKRAESLRSQPNEISFPGGKIEPGESPKEAAIRETMEELCIDQEHIQILGEMDYLPGRDGRNIRCYVGRLINIELEEIKPNPGEVGQIFAVPLEFFWNKEPDEYSLKLSVDHSDDFPYELIPGGKDYDWKKSIDTVYFYDYKKWIIWGFTAKMTKGFIDILKGKK